MSTETILLLLLIVFLAASLPAWPYSKSWGYAPTGVLTLLIIVFVVWAITGDRPLFRDTGRDIQSAVQEAGQDIKEAGRDVGDSIRGAVQ